MCVQSARSLWTKKSESAYKYFTPCCIPQSTVPPLSPTLVTNWPTLNALRQNRFFLYDNGSGRFSEFRRGGYHGNMLRLLSPSLIIHRTKLVADQFKHRKSLFVYSPVPETTPQETDSVVPSNTGNRSSSNLHGSYEAPPPHRHRDVGSPESRLCQWAGHHPSSTREICSEQTPQLF